MEKEEKKEKKDKRDKKDKKDKKDKEEVEFEEVKRKIEERHKKQIKFVKELGSGSFGKVFEIRVNHSSKTYAGKIIKIKDPEKGSDELKLAKQLKGQNIIKFSKTIEERVNHKNYCLLIMEKAALKDLGKLTDFYFKKNLVKTIFQPFCQPVGDNLARYYCIQIVQALEILNRNSFVHFDIKPENILVTVNLILKLTDFSLLRDLKTMKEDTMTSPGGTWGYFSPEYFLKKKLDKSTLKKQDYFALGCTIFYLKYGKSMIRMQKYDDNEMKCDRTIDIINDSIPLIKSKAMDSNNFKYFLTGLINVRPEERLSFEQIYRNKWLNENREIIKSIFYGFENDEEKIILEFLKSDTICEKEKYISEKHQDIDVYSGDKFKIEYKKKKYYRKKKSQN